MVSVHVALCIEDLEQASRKLNKGWTVTLGNLHRRAGVKMEIVDKDVPDQVLLRV